MGKRGKRQIAPVDGYLWDTISFKFETPLFAQRWKNEREREGLAPVIGECCQLKRLPFEVIEIKSYLSVEWVCIGM